MILLMGRLLGVLHTSEDDSRMMAGEWEGCCQLSSTGQVKCFRLETILTITIHTQSSHSSGGAQVHVS